MDFGKIKYTPGRVKVIKVNGGRFMKKIICLVISLLILINALPVSVVAKDSLIHFERCSLNSYTSGGVRYIDCEFSTDEKCDFDEESFSKISIEEKQGSSWTEVGKIDANNADVDSYPGSMLHYAVFKIESYSKKIRVRFKKGTLVDKDTGKINEDFIFDEVNYHDEFRIGLEADTNPRENAMSENTFIFGKSIKLSKTPSVSSFKVIDCATGEDIRLNGYSFTPKNLGENKYAMILGKGLLKIEFSLTTMNEDEYFAMSKVRMQKLEQLKKEHKGERGKYVLNSLDEASATYFGLIMAAPISIITVPFAPVIIAVMSYILGLNKWEDSLMELI